MNATAIVKRPVLEAIESNKEKFALRLPPGMDATRFMLGLATAVQKNPALMNCDPHSVILAAYDAAELGISLSPSLALGWIIPYGNTAQFQASYRAFIQKAYETGNVRAFFAEVVYAKDTFQRQFAPKRSLLHTPADGDRGEPIGAYALVEFNDGTLDWEYMSKEQVERHRRASKQPESMMWTKFWEEGWRKTPVRVLAKRLPLKGIERLVELLTKDEERDILPIDGSIELEKDSVLATALPVATATAELPQSNGVRTAMPDPTLTYKVGKLITTITGNVSKILPELRKLEGRLNKEDNSWTIPVNFTQEFVDACEKKGIAAAEIGEGSEHFPNPFDETQRTFADL